VQPKLDVRKKILLIWVISSLYSPTSVFTFFNESFFRYNHRYIIWFYVNKKHPISRVFRSWWRWSVSRKPSSLIIRALFKWLISDYGNTSLFCFTKPSICHNHIFMISYDILLHTTLHCEFPPQQISICRGVSFQYSYNVSCSWSAGALERSRSWHPCAD
jgi:hypothetical protein